MGEVVDKPATYADIEALPPNVVGEILYGRLVTHPRPAPAHAFALFRLVIEIGNPFGIGSGGPGGWYILIEPEIHMGGHVVVPDMAGWRKDRLSGLPETAAFHIAPDWACEILSPSTQRHDKGDKRTIYAEIGVKHLWYVDPVSRGLETYHLSGDDWMAGKSYFDNDPVSAPPFEAITFSLGELWDDPETPAANPSEAN